jgi:hypothetical protein
MSDRNAVEVDVVDDGEDEHEEAPLVAPGAERLSATSSSSPHPHPECRICREGEELPDRPLLTPCDCTGSQAKVHADCLKRWMQARPGGEDDDEAFAEEDNAEDGAGGAPRGRRAAQASFAAPFGRCEVCLAPYRVVTEPHFRGDDPAYRYSRRAAGPVCQGVGLVFMAGCVVLGLYLALQNAERGEAGGEGTPADTTPPPPSAGSLGVLLVLAAATVACSMWALRAVRARWRLAVSEQVLRDVPVRRRAEGGREDSA